MSNDIDMNLNGIREVATVHYAGLAEDYNDIWQVVKDVSKSVKVSEYPDVEKSIRNYIAKVAQFLEVSEFRLTACGDALIQLADGHGKVDEETAGRIEGAVIGLVSGEDTTSSPPDEHH